MEAVIGVLFRSVSRPLPQAVPGAAAPGRPPATQARAVRARPAVRRPGAVLAVLVGAAIALAGCGSSSGGSSSGGSPAPATSGAQAAPASSAAAQPSCPSATAPVTPVPTFDTTQQAIATNWERFFSKDTPIAAKLCLVQGGAPIAAAIQGFATSPFAAQISANVTNVEVQGSQATVTYSILGGNGTTLLPNATGTAVLDNGSWKVSATSLCALLQLAGPVPGVCSGASASASS